MKLTKEQRNKLVDILIKDLAICVKQSSGMLYSLLLNGHEGYAHRTDMELMKDAEDAELYVGFYRCPSCRGEGHRQRPGAEAPTECSTCRGTGVVSGEWED
jgi:hypothetical protein